MGERSERIKGGEREGKEEREEKREGRRGREMERGDKLGKEGEVILEYMEQN